MHVWFCGCLACQLIELKGKIKGRCLMKVVMSIIIQVRFYNMMLLCNIGGLFRAKTSDFNLTHSTYLDEVVAAI